MIIRTAKKALTFALATMLAYSILAPLFAIDGEWDWVIAMGVLVVIDLYLLIRAFQIILFWKREFTLTYCLDRKEYAFYNDIEDVYITTVIQEGKKPEKWIILRHMEQSFDQIHYLNLESFVQGTAIISFPYSERREKLMDRHFPGKKKYATLHDKTGVLEEVEPTEMPSAE